MPKVGKTTLATRPPGTLLLAAELGYNALPDVMAKPINSWADFKVVLSELREPEVQEIFQVVTIDTVDKLYNMCEKYICGRESTSDTTYETIRDIPYGAGYKLIEKEFDEALCKILSMNFGLILVSHATEKTFEDEYGEEYSQIIPTIDKRGRIICERLCDFICYCKSVQDPETHQKTSKMFFRGTKRFVAGSRFRYIRDYADMNYETLLESVHEAIDREEQALSGSTVDEVTQVRPQEKTYDFEAQMSAFKEKVNEIITKDSGAASKITTIVETHLGPNKKVSECTPQQSEQLELILFDLDKEFPSAD